MDVNILEIFIMLERDDVGSELNLWKLVVWCTCNNQSKYWLHCFSIDYSLKPSQKRQYYENIRRGDDEGNVRLMESLHTFSIDGKIVHRCDQNLNPSVIVMMVWGDGGGVIAKRISWESDAD